MLIDWFTVAGQVVNFLILVWLMKRFLYHPILDAIDAREQRIAGELADAAAMVTEAKKERDEFQRKNEELDQQRSALMKTATQQANAERQRLLDEAREAADALSAKRAEALKIDARNLNQEISRLARTEVFAIVRKTLGDLAGERLEARMVEVFISRLRELDEASKEQLGEALKTATEAAVLRSTFELPAEQCKAIQQALKEIFQVAINLRFETAPEQIGVIEFSANGQKVAWSIDDYLVSLEKSVSELMNGRTKPAGQSKPKPEAKSP